MEPRETLPLEGSDSEPGFALYDVVFTFLLYSVVATVAVGVVLGTVLLVRALSR